MGNSLCGKNVLRTADFEKEELETVLQTAKRLRALREQNVSPKVFDSGLAVSMVNNNRDTGMDFAFAAGCDLLGLTLREVPGRAQNSAIEEEAAMTSFFSDVVGIRDSEYIEKSARYMRRMANAYERNAEGGAVFGRPFVLNLESDEDSPVETLALLEAAAENFGGTENLKGKKLALCWAYSPDGTRPLSVPQGILSLFSRFGFAITLASPEGYDLLPGTEEKTAEACEKSGGSFTKVTTMEEALNGADIVCPVNWAPYSFLESKTEIYAGTSDTAIEILEMELKEKNAGLVDWEYTESKEELTKDGKAVLFHPLPADVTDLSCVRGEMTAQVYHAHARDLFGAAEFRPYIVAALILLSCCEDPEEAFTRMEKEGAKRCFGKKA